MSTPEVSVVIPVFNGGPQLVDAVGSALGQSMQRGDYEIIVVDDGSTDGSGEWLDIQAAANAGSMTVIHLERSGSPGRPRNVGIRAARGGYVQLLDADDLLAPEALRRMHRLAVDSQADVVAGKLASDFRDVDHAPFRSTVRGVTLRTFPLTELSLTPHKMFRREFLIANDVWFAEAPRHAEDALFCMHAYLHGARVSIVGDYTCYYYRRRCGFGRNLGDVEADPAAYFRDIADILDLIDRHEPAPDFRRSLYGRFVRTEMLGRLRGRLMRGYTHSHRLRVVHEIADLLDRWVDPAATELLPAIPRIQAHHVRRRDIAALTGVAEATDGLRLQPVVTSRWVDETLELRIAARLSSGNANGPEGKARNGGSALPEALTQNLPRPAEALRLSDAITEVDVVISSRETGETWFVPGALSVTVRSPDVLRVSGAATLDPLTAAGGCALTRGLWDVKLRYVLGGVRRTGTMRPAWPPPPMRLLGAGHLSVLPYQTDTQALALDVGEWMHAPQWLPGAEADASERTLRISAPAVTAARTLTLPAEVIVAVPHRAPRLVAAIAYIGTTGTRITVRVPWPEHGPNVDVWWRIRRGPVAAAAAPAVGRANV